ncbi:MAG: hypothetical protein OXF06_12240 [Bacteroidetes bacterium]|nr:hypothetical protein [Bacteroidota bacterium]
MASKTHDTIIRFYDDISHAQEFISGKIRIGRLKYYRDMEASDGRGDRNEGVSLLLKGDYTILVGPANTPPTEATYRPFGLASCIRFSDHSDLHSYILSLSRIEITVDEDTSMAKTLNAPLRELISSLMPHASVVYGVLVLDGEEFMRRMMALPIPVEGAPVSYTDLDTPRNRQMEVGAFTKDAKFKAQNEYRLKFMPESTENHTYVDVGDLSKYVKLIEFPLK